MKTAVLFLTVLGCTLAVPNGYYHQEYNYKTSSSSYKNNELQHKTDDQGYYKKDGDLAGRVRPRVDANSEHSEYVNPNLRNGDYNTGIIGTPNGDLSSYGHLRANLGSYGSQDLAAEGTAHSDRIRGYSSGAYDAGNYGSSAQYGVSGASNYGSSAQYGVSGASNYGSNAQYGVSSNLRSVTSHIQQDLERDLLQAIQENRGYSQSEQLGFNELERELKRNLTNRFNDELLSKYGQQSIRGGLSYTISNGRVHSTANYDNQELLDLRRQIENSLLNRLRTQYNQAYAGSSSSRYESVHGSSHSGYGFTTTTIRPVYYVQYPTTTYRPFTAVIPTYPVDYGHSNNIRYTPVSNPESITTIASRVQNQLDARLNQILEDVQRRYFSSSSSYSLTNTDVLLERLRNELRSNVTYSLDEDIRRNYGTQVQRDGNMYSVGSGGQTSNQYNYATGDLQNLKSQIERNLIEKLNRDFERYRTSWSQQYRQSSYGGHQSYGEYSTPRYVHTTPRYDVYTTPYHNVYDSEVEHLTTRPSSSHLIPLITGGAGSSSQNRHYLVAGTGQSGYEVSGGGSGSISQLQSQLQQDLSRQLQAAISRGQYGSYSTSGSYSPQAYQTSLQQLSDELNRNLTRQLQGYSSSSYYSTYGNFDEAQLATLRNQLQADLMRQLQQGLRQSFQSSSSYSSSSSSSSSGNYRPTRGFQNYQLGQYKTGGNVATYQGEDCLGDDPNAYINHRMKRSYQPYRSQPIGLSHGGSHSANSYGYGGNFVGGASVSTSYDRRNQLQLGQQVEELGQEEDESDLTQQVEDSGYGKLQLGSQSQQQVQLGQQVDDSDLTQQVEDSRLGKLQSQHQQQIGLGQQVDNSDLTQQVEDSGYGKLQLGSQGQQQLGQQIDESDLTQQVEDSGYGKLQLGSQSQQVQLGQQVDDSDLTQQVEDSGYGKLQLGSQSQQQVQLGQQVDSDLTQQVEDSGYGKLQLGSQSQQQVQLGQQVDDSDLTQQVEDSGYGKLHLGSQSQQQVQLGQQVDESDLTQQVEDSKFGQLQVGPQTQHQTDLGQQVDNVLTQNLENSGYGRLQLGLHHQQHIGQGKQVVDSDLTQQVEDSGFGKLRLPSQNQQVSHLTHQQEVDSGFGKLQVGQQHQQQSELGQQVEDFGETQEVEGLGSGKIQLGSQTQQIELGQQVDDSVLTQQLESGKLQTGSQIQQQIEGGQQIDDTDLTQQVESTGLGQLQLGSHQSQNQDNSDLTQQVEYPGFEQPQRHQIGLEQQGHLIQQQRERGRLQFVSQGQQQITLGQQKLTQQQIQIANQLENDLSKQLQDAIQNQRYKISYSLTESPSPQLYQISLQQLSNELQRNLTRQLQDTSSGGNRYGPRYSYTVSGNFNDQQLAELKEKLKNELLRQLQKDLKRSFSYSASWSSSSQNNLGNFKDFNQKQIQAANKLEKELSNQLRDAVRTRYTISYSTSGNVEPNVLYQNLINELQRNLTKELQTVSPSSSSYSYSYTFNNQQLNKLREQLENDLKLQLQQEVSSITNTNNLGQKPVGNYGLTQKQTDDPDLLQQVQHSDLIQVEHDTFRKPEVSNSQQLDNSGQQVTVNSFNSPQLEGQQILQNLNRNQIKFIQQLEADLSNQLKNAIKITYSTPTSQPQTAIYQQLTDELQKNITKQLSEIKTGRSVGKYSYFIYHSFTDEQLVKLRKQIENNLKFLLQNEIFLHGSNSQQAVPQRGDIYGNLELGGQLQVGQKQDLPQQIEDNVLGSTRPSNQQQSLFKPGQEEEYDLTQQVQDNNSGRLQLGNRPIEQQSVSRDDELQQVEDTKFGPEQFGQQQVVQQPIEPERTDQLQQIDKAHVPEKLQLGQQTEDDSQVTQEQTDLNQQVHNNYPSHFHIPSANLQLNARPLLRRPVDSSSFLQTEINHQQQDLLNSNAQVSSQQQITQQPQNLPTFNQVNQQINDVIDSEEYRTELPKRVEPLRVYENEDNLTQQTDKDQQIEVEAPQSPIVHGQVSVSGIGEQTPTLQPIGRQPSRVTGQGQFIIHSQSLTGAENEADLLVQKLRESQRNRPSHSVPSEGSTYTYYNQPVSQVVSHGGYDGYRHRESSGSYGTPSVQFTSEQEINQQPGSFGLYLNQGQVQFAKQLEDELSKQLQDAVNQNYDVVTHSTSSSTTPELYQLSYQQLSQDLQRNLTKELQGLLSGGTPHGSSSVSYSVYGTLTDQQRQKLLNQLQTDLLKQLQQNLRVTYGLQQSNNDNSYSFSGGYSSSLGGSSGYRYRHRQTYSSNDQNVGNGAEQTFRSQVHYGQPGEVQQNFDTSSDLKQIELQRANTVQNVESQVDTVGLKGHKGYDAHLIDAQSPPQSQQSGGISLSLPGASVSVTQDVKLDEPSPDVIDQNVPWWKKIGSTVRQGAHSLKEKIIG